MSKSGKIVVIVTHNANIGVRTWPYSVIYRELSGDSSENKTFIGSAFLRHFEDLNSTETSYSWEETSEKILEGGQDAFNERARIYGRK
ncbi:MAG: hypothetical protein EIB84_01690 [Spiroplasma poulsonii]|nr:hypothetical protein [Spiroplasma poulsonii]